MADGEKCVYFQAILLKTGKGSGSGVWIQQDWTPPLPHPTQPPPVIDAMEPALEGVHSPTRSCYLCNCGHKLFHGWLGFSLYQFSPCLLESFCLWFVGMLQPCLSLSVDVQPARWRDSAGWWPDAWLINLDIQITHCFP